MHAAAGPGRHLRPAHWPALGSSGGVQDPHVGRESVRDHGAHRGPEAAQPRPQPVGRGDVGRRMQFVVVHQVGPTGQGSSIVSACEGVLKPGICRGRPLSSAAIRSRSAWLYWRRSTVLGRYWRTSPLAFSLLARLPVSLPVQGRLCGPAATRRSSGNRLHSAARPGQTTGFGQQAAERGLVRHRAVQHHGCRLHGHRQPPGSHSSADRTESLRRPARRISSLPPPKGTTDTPLRCRVGFGRVEAVALGLACA